MSGASLATDGGIASGGVGGTKFGTLSSVGSDLSVSVSFSIASELLATANDLQIKEDELIGVVLGFSVVFAAVEARLAAMIRSRRAQAISSARKLASKEIEEFREAAKQVGSSEAALLGSLNEKMEASFVSAAVSEAERRATSRRSLLDFLHLLASIAARIGLAISIQLLAASVRAQQPSRLVRTISLASLAAFFVFVEALAGRAIQ